mgnify:CR=1 FL=1
MIVASKDAVFDGSRSILWFKDSLLFLDFEDMIAKNTSKECISSSFLTRPLWPVENDMLYVIACTGKSYV